MLNHSKRSLKRSRHRGATLVYLAIIMIALVGFVGLGVDTGYVFLTGHQLQNAADAAALAGADDVTFDTSLAVTDAVNAAAANKAARTSVTLDSANDVVVGNYNRTTSTFTANTSPYNAVQVTTRRTTGSPDGPLSLIFGPMVGVTTSNVSRTATAMNSQIGAAILLLSSSASPAIQLTGTGANSDKILVTNGGAIVVDSSSSSAIQWTGHPYMTAAELDIVGNDTAVTSGGVYPSGTLNLQAPVVPDPLASLAAPSKPGTAGTQNAKGEWLPGYYASGLPSGVLAGGGIYWIDGGISLNGNKSISDDSAGGGEMIYLNTGGISLGGNTSLAVNAMTTGTYAGISIFQARTNTSGTTLQGTPGQTSTGTLYLPAANVSIAGNPTSFGNQLIASTLSVQGNAQLNIAYDGRNMVPRHRAFLVK